MSTNCCKRIEIAALKQLDTTAVGYELIEDEANNLPVLTAMSEIAGMLEPGPCRPQFTNKSPRKPATYLRDFHKRGLVTSAVSEADTSMAHGNCGGRESSTGEHRKRSQVRAEEPSPARGD